MLQNSTHSFRASILHKARFNLASTRFLSVFSPVYQSAETKESPQKLDRFWKESTVELCSEGFKIKIDSRYLKTTNGTVLVLPKEQEVCAALVAAEWESQKKTISTHSLPLTSIVFRSFDGLSTNEDRSKVVKDLIKYMETDTILFHAEYPEKLVILQKECWDPIIEWAKSEFQIDLLVFTSLFNTAQIKSSITKLQDHVNKFSPLKLAAFEKAVLVSKSFLIALALVEGKISAQQAAKAARVEALAQTSYWGSFENAHEMDEALVSRDLGASACSLIVTHDHSGLEAFFYSQRYPRC